MTVTGEEMAPLTDTSKGVDDPLDQFSLSLEVIEEIADQELLNEESDTKTLKNCREDDNGSVAAEQENGHNEFDILLGHDRTTKERSLDVVAVGKEAGTKFEDLQLRPEVVKGLTKCRFEYPSPIQINAIPHGKFGFDLIMQSKSGTGKTCAFGVIILENMDWSAEEMEHIQALIISPTREVACQSNTVIKFIGSYVPGLKAKEFIGGTSVQQCIRRTKKCNIASGTPGRLLHMIDAQEMDLSHVKIVVLDEADRLMEHSFLETVSLIFKALPKEKQVIASSATYPVELREFLKRFLRTPIDITIDYTAELLAVNLYTADVFSISSMDADLNSRQGGTKKNLSQAAVFDKKMEVLMKILQTVKYTQAIIFSKFILVAERIHLLLKELSFDVALLTGGLSQETRLKSLREAKDGKCKILICSDLGARGIDCEAVDLVVNFELPDDSCTFVHRFGRAGRFGSPGSCITLVTGKMEYTRLAEYVSVQKLDVRRLTNVADLKSMGNTSGRPKFRKVFQKEEIISTHSGEFSNWKEVYNRCMTGPFEYPSLELDAGYGVSVDFSVSKNNALLTDISNLEQLLK